MGPASWTDNGLIIRPLTQADQDEAKRLVLDGLAQHFGFLDPSLNTDLADIASSYIDQGNLFVVAVFDGRLVGTGGLVFNDQRHGQIVRLSVKKEWRRKGIGRALVNHLAAVCRQRELQIIEVETNLDWTEAAKFYRSCGFIDHICDTERITLQLRLKPTVHE